MDFAYLSPPRQLTEIISRIYQQRLTTTSGGNLSILDENGDIWITPAAIDKGALTPEDIVRVRPDHSYEGRHKPSSELPFHRQIYEARPDIRAIVHAHPPGLVAFSIAHLAPNTAINPQSQAICGQVGYAAYALPGSELLGTYIADAFADGANAVLLENHGVVTGGPDLLQTFQCFETFEFCAQINIRASALGAFHTLSDEQVQLFQRAATPMPEFTPSLHTSQELELRLQICEFVQRAYERQLMISTGGTVSARVKGNRFLITPYGFDRKYATPEGIVLIDDGQREAGKTPSRAVQLHAQIYRDHPEINCIMSAQPPNATAYSIVQQGFDTRIIPESYIVLREMPVAPYGLQYQQPEAISAMISTSTPVILLRNDAVLTTGTTILEAFDRIEVAEFSAQALIQALSIGDFVPMSEEKISDLKRRFSL
ncbi:MAG: class II aldolase/adducin family protein [Anaerolineae bacterium]|nr:class II aldolase/adducin family protein [Anaerolineae bacterium]